MPYDLKPIEAYSTKPGVADICAMVTRGEVSQRVAQAAAWHLNSGMSWEELAAKKIEHLVGPDTPYFSHEELAIAYKAAEVAKEREAARAKASKSESSSSSYTGAE